jgi:hypothetical protein
MSLPQPQHKTNEFSYSLKRGIRNLAHLTRHLKCIHNVHTGPGFISLSGTIDPHNMSHHFCGNQPPPPGRNKKEYLNMQTPSHKTHNQYRTLNAGTMNAWLNTGSLG